MSIAYNEWPRKAVKQASLKEMEQVKKKKISTLLMELQVKFREQILHLLALPSCRDSGLCVSVVIKNQ